MGDHLKGKNAVVTGGGNGIGKAVCLALAAEGANVVVCDYGGAVDYTGTDKGPADAVAAECQKLGVKAVANYGDVSKFDAAADMVKACVDNFGSIDIVCNIAGIDKPKMIWNMSELEWDAVIGVHLKGSFNLTRHATPLMREQKSGVIINCVSEAYQGGPGHLNYAAAKGGIATLTYGTALELGRYGVRCNSFIPRAATRMVMSDDVMAGLKKRVEAGVMSQEKYDDWMHHMAGPEYFAELIAYLCSDEAADINGQIFLGAGSAIGIFSQPKLAVQIPRDWEKEGVWTYDEVKKQMREKILPEYGYVNPAPKQSGK